MEFIGMNDSFGESGQPYELLNKYGMTSKNIIEKCYKILSK
jgi:transketolase